MGCSSVARGGTTPSSARRELGYIAVGDSTLNYGGGAFFTHLPAVPAGLTTVIRPNEWTLVLSIHGAQDLVADVGEQVRTGEPDAYDATRVRSIFSTSACICAPTVLGD